MILNKQLENKLNTLNDLKASLENIPKVLESNTLEVKTIEEAINSLTDREQDVIKRICINGETPEEVAKDYNKTPRMIYCWKNAALKSLNRKLYGSEE